MKNIYRAFKRKITYLGIFFVFFSAVFSYFVYQELIDSFSREEFEELGAIRDTLSNHILDYLHIQEITIASIASDKTTLDAFQKFNTAFKEINSNNIVIDEEKLKREISKFLKRVRVDVLNSNPKREIDDYLPKQYAGKVLQYLYISNNPIYLNRRGDFFSSNGNTYYDKVHKRYHPYFYKKIRMYGIYDIFLIDMDGNIIYTSRKEADFGTNIKNGVFANSNLGKIFRESLKSDMKTGEVIFSGFQPYEASNNELAGFLLTPIMINNKRVGVVAIQINLNHINSIMHFKGDIDSYLVNSDGVMLTDSIYISQIKNPKIKERWSSSGILKLNLPYIKNALSDKSGEIRTTNYIGKDVLISYKGIEFQNIKMGLIVEVSFDKVLSNISRYIYLLLFNYLLPIVTLIVVIPLFLIKFIIQSSEKKYKCFKRIIQKKNHYLKETINLLNEYKMAVDYSSIIVKTDANKIITDVNKSFCEISGYSEKELIGKSLKLIKHPNTPKEFWQDLWNTVSNNRTWKGVIHHRKKDGGSYYAHTTIIPLLNSNGEIHQYFFISKDITKFIEKEKQIVQHTRDDLTKLANRQKLLNDINKNSPEDKIVGIIKINKLKEIGDFYGINIANNILINISKVLSNIFSQNSSTLYRIDSAEFAVLQKGNINTNDFLNKIENLVRYFDYNIVIIDDNSFNISITVGVAYGKDNSIISNAKIALRRAIETGRDVAIFDKVLDLDEYQKNIEMTIKIKNAIKDRDIVIFGQEIVPNFEVLPYKKFEVLIRMFDGANTIPPGIFLDVAKKARLYSTLTKIVIEKSFLYFRDRNDEFSINLNLEDILNIEIVNLLKREIIKNKIGHRVILELVESEGIENFETVHNFINEFKSLGCRVAIDDFGTGYSNFEYLMRLNVDFIKIDGSLIKNIDRDADAQLVVKLIVDFAKNKSIKTVAEFIDRESVLEKVKELGIDYSQGFYLSKPSLLQ